MQNGHALLWAKSLRSRSPSPNADRGRQKHGASIASGADVKLSKSADFSKTAASGNADDGRALDGRATFTRSNEEYIMSLQQQVHFLEMDTARVRQEAQAAAEMHPKMTAEAEQMLVKLRELQVSVDDFTLQLQRVEAEIEHAVGDRNLLNTRLDSEIGLRAKDRQMLAHEVMLARKGKEDAAIDGVRKDSRLREALEKNEELRRVLREVEERNVELASLLDQRAEEHCLMLIALEEKVAHLALASNHLESTKLRYAESTTLSRDKTVSKLKTEVQLLRRALGIPTASLAATPPALTKQGTRALTLAEENGLLKERAIELTTRIAMEKNLRKSMTLQLEEETAEVARLYARTKDLLLQLQLQQVPPTSPRHQRSNSNAFDSTHTLQYDGFQDRAMLDAESHRAPAATVIRHTIDASPPSHEDRPEFEVHKIVEGDRLIDGALTRKQLKKTSFSDLNSPGNRREFKRGGTTTREEKAAHATNGTVANNSESSSSQRQSGVEQVGATAALDNVTVLPSTASTQKPNAAAHANTPVDEKSKPQEKDKQIISKRAPDEKTVNRRPSDDMDQLGSDVTEQKAAHGQPVADESSTSANKQRTVSSADNGTPTGETSYVQIDVPLVDVGQAKNDAHLAKDRTTAPLASAPETKQQQQQPKQLSPVLASKEFTDKQPADKSWPILPHRETHDSKSNAAQTDLKERQSTDREAPAVAPGRRRSLNDDLALLRQQQQKRHQVRQTDDLLQQQLTVNEQQ